LFGKNYPNHESIASDLLTCIPLFPYFDKMSQEGVKSDIPFGVSFPETPFRFHARLNPGVEIAVRVAVLGGQEIEKAE
jgi:hypothetical protein